MPRTHIVGAIMSDQPNLAATGKEEIVREALLQVARNVAKHLIQRSGWHEGDECFQLDLREAEESLLGLTHATEADNARLRADLLAVGERIAELEGAIGPFAAYAGRLFRDRSDVRIGYHDNSPTVGACRHAAEVLSRKAAKE